MHKNHLEALQHIETPAYVADIAAIKRNLEKAKYIREQAGVKILLATKAFSMYSVFPIMSEYLDGTTASGLYEARLGANHFGKEVHTYSPAYKEDDLLEILQYSNHIYFNSISQLNKYGDLVREKRKDAIIGLRVNPQLSLVKNSELYDPSAPNSRFGIHKEELTESVLAKVDLLHFHNLCENLAEDSVRLISHISEKFDFAIKNVSRINIGGGHYYSHPEYDIDLLIKTLKNFRTKYNIDVTLEPGGAHLYDAGYLVSSVIDTIENNSHIAIIDASASTHMPDVLEVPYTPKILNAEIHTKENTINNKSLIYTLGGNTCMTGDIIGTYRFDDKLHTNDKIIFTDMMQYTTVKNTTFNGVPLPNIGILHENGKYELIKKFNYKDFEDRL